MRVSYTLAEINATASFVAAVAAALNGKRLGTRFSSLSMALTYINEQNKNQKSKIEKIYIEGDFLVVEVDEEYFVEMMEVITRQSGVVVGAITAFKGIALMFKGAMETMADEFKKLNKKFSK